MVFSILTKQLELSGGEPLRTPGPAANNKPLVDSLTSSVVRNIKPELNVGNKRINEAQDTDQILNQFPMDALELEWIFEKNWTATNSQQWPFTSSSGRGKAPSCSPIGGRMISVIGWSGGANLIRTKTPLSSSGSPRALLRMSSLKWTTRENRMWSLVCRDQRGKPFTSPW